MHHCLFRKHRWHAGQCKYELKHCTSKAAKCVRKYQSPFFYQATIFDNKSGEAVILKEVGNDKYISFFNAGEWREKNKQWEDVSVNITGENKKLLNYNCRKAIIND